MKKKSRTPFLFINNLNITKIYNIIRHKRQLIYKKIFILRQKIKIERIGKEKLELICSKFKSKNHFNFLTINKKNSNEISEFYVKNCFNILGQRLQFNNKINWHKDPKSNEIVEEWKYAFYSDIKIKTKSINNLNDYHPDAKIPWELSRLQHLPQLGYEFKRTRNKKHLTIFVEHIESWIDNNDFLYGINWVCPMDVSIRSINIIHGINYLKKELPNKVLRKIINSLYQHAIYLEHNWELFYKNNNHYITNLLGYFYLCFIFGDEKQFENKKKKTLKKILKQFDEQIMRDGTCYEGSTSYHKLVTEIFILFKNLCIKNKLQLPNTFTAKLEKSKQFINDCTDNFGNFVQIGDNDSGCIVKSEPIKINRTKNISHYPDFGLTVIKNNEWHITYRHPTYKINQPTGHFHQDSLSITISYKGTPILVDTGTGVYTSNKKIRDNLRCYSSHNTFYIDNEDLNKQDIFLLNKNEQTDTSIIKKNDKAITITNYYKQQNQRLYRKLIFNKKEKINITDWIIDSTIDNNARWNFIFHPEIEIKKIEKKAFLIIRKKKTLLVLRSTLDLKISRTFFSGDYGKIEDCYKLSSKEKICTNKIITTLEKT